MRSNYSLPAITIGTIPGLVEFILQVDEADRAKVFISWTGLTGTLNGVFQVMQRTDPNGVWHTFSVDALKTLSTASGTWYFLLNDLCDDDIKLMFTKNACTGGTITMEIGLR